MKGSRRRLLRESMFSLLCLMISPNWAGVPVPSETAVDGMAVEETIGDAVAPETHPTTHSMRLSDTGLPVLTDLDFFRGEQGQAKLVLRGLQGIPRLRIERQSNFLVIELPQMTAISGKVGRLDVEDFLTPVVQVRVERDDPPRLWLQLAGNGPVHWYEQPVDHGIVLEVQNSPDFRHFGSPARAASKPVQGISLDFQDVDVRSVLTLFADFTGLNIVATEQVSGRLTLRLDQVPWEQALDLILDVLALGQQRVGDVIIVRPRAEFEARELERLRREREVAGLEPTETVLLAVQHGSAEDFRKILANFAPAKAKSADPDSQSASIHVDSRTNTLILHGPASRVRALSDLVRALDAPTPQVLVETRIIIAEDSYLRDLGSRFGVSGTRRLGASSIGFSGQMAAAADLAEGMELGLLMRPDLPQRLNWALPLPAAGTGALSILRRGVILDLELRALEEQGRGEILSNPRIVTSSGQKASISDGNQIPYRTVTEAGSPGEVRLVPANLSAVVTPVVTPSQQIILQIEIKKDEPNFALVVDGQPAIRGRAIETQVVVNDGETVVLGGVFEHTLQSRQQRVPVLGELPVMGRWFRNQVTSNGHTELAVLVTPYILP